MKRVFPMLYLHLLPNVRGR
ncbi:hypothetical protein R3I94_019973 [Phoxinus phoxinus]